MCVVSCLCYVCEFVYTVLCLCCVCECVLCCVMDVMSVCEISVREERVK